MKRKSTFDEKIITPQQLEQGVVRNADGSPNDDLEINHGNPADAKFAQPPVGVPTKGFLMDQAGLGEEIFNTDPKAYERESTAQCIASPVVMTDHLEAQVLAAGMLQAALESPDALSRARVPNSQRKELANALADVARELPTPDAVTIIDNRRVVLPAEVRDIPNRIPKTLSMKVLELIIGEELCLKAVKCARQAGVCFYQKPCLWIAQRLAYELSKRRIWERLDIPSTGDYDPKDDGDKDSQVCKAIGQLFSYHVMEQMQVICATRQISMLQCAKVLINRICDIANEEKAPKDYADKYDALETLEQALGKLDSLKIA